MRLGVLAEVKRSSGDSPSESLPLCALSLGSASQDTLPSRCLLTPSHRGDPADCKAWSSGGRSDAPISCATLAAVGGGGCSGAVCSVEANNGAPIGRYRMLLGRALQSRRRAVYTAAAGGAWPLPPAEIDSSLTPAPTPYPSPAAGRHREFYGAE